MIEEYTDREHTSGRTRALYEAAGRAHEIVECLKPVRDTPRTVHLELVARMKFRMMELHDTLLELQRLERR